MTELMHFGVPGMKWGHRKYRNSDGSLSKAGQKRLDKMEKYRTKLANKADKKQKKYKSLEDEANSNVKDLKKNGRNSAAYKKWKESQDREREWDYERENSINGLDGTKYVKKYNTSGTRIMNDVIDYCNSDRKIAELIVDNKRDAEYYNSKANKWMNSNKGLMNMNVSELTNKRDIRKAYRS